MLRSLYPSVISDSDDPVKFGNVLFHLVRVISFALKTYPDIEDFCQIQQDCLAAGKLQFIEQISGIMLKMRQLCKGLVYRLEDPNDAKLVSFWKEFEQNKETHQRSAQAVLAVPNETAGFDQVIQFCVQNMTFLVTSNTNQFAMVLRGLDLAEANSQQLEVLLSYHAAISNANYRCFYILRKLYAIKVCRNRDEQLRLVGDLILAMYATLGCALTEETLRIPRNDPLHYYAIMMVSKILFADTVSPRLSIQLSLVMLNWGRTILSLLTLLPKDWQAAYPHILPDTMICIENDNVLKIDDVKAAFVQRTRERLERSRVSGYFSKIISDIPKFLDNAFKDEVVGLSKLGTFDSALYLPVSSQEIGVLENRLPIPEPKKPTTAPKKASGPKVRRKKNAVAQKKKPQPTAAVPSTDLPPSQFNDEVSILELPVVLQVGEPCLEDVEAQVGVQEVVEENVEVKEETLEEELGRYEAEWNSSMYNYRTSLDAARNCYITAAPERQPVEIAKHSVAFLDTADFQAMLPEADLLFRENTYHDVANIALTDSTMQFQWIFNPAIVIDQDTYLFLCQVFGLVDGSKKLTYSEFIVAVSKLGGGSIKTKFWFSHSFTLNNGRVLHPPNGTVHPEHKSSRFNYRQVDKFLTHAGAHPYFFRVIKSKRPLPSFSESDIQQSTSQVL